MRNDTIPLLTEYEFSIFENTGNRLTYEKIYFKRREFLAVYGIASVIWKRKEDIEKLENVLLDICNELCWALPAHVDRKCNSLWSITIDLFAAETAQALSMIVYYLNEELRSEIIETAKYEINRRVFTPYFNESIPFHSWEHLTNNWCAVCSGCIGSAALYLIKDDIKFLERFIDRVRSSLTYYIKGFEEDGVCTEGIGYYFYGMVYYVQFAMQLMEYSHGKIDLLKGEKIKKIALFWQACYFGGGQTVSFSDGSSLEMYRIGLALKLLSITNYQTTLRYVIPDISRAADFDYDTCYRFAALWQDYVWSYEWLGRNDEDRCLSKIETNCTKSMMIRNSMYSSRYNDSHNEIHDDKYDEKYNDLCKDTHKDIIFPISQWVIKENKENVGFATKGGHNGESHNHNDVGSFLYVNGNDMLLTDLGAGEYTKDYFSSKRYEILNCRSLGHNVPLIMANDTFMSQSMGLEQVAGNEYRCSDFSVDGEGKVSIEFGMAYEKGLIKKAIRELDFNYADGSLTITDSFYFDEESLKEVHFQTIDLMSAKADRSVSMTITENLVTTFLPDIRDNYIYISGNTKGCRIHVIDECEIKIIKTDYANHEGIKEIAWLIQWEKTFYNDFKKEEPFKVSFIIEPLNLD